jgi:hypothetical protein
MIRGCGFDYAQFMNKQAKLPHPVNHRGYGEILTKDGTKIFVMYGQVHTSLIEGLYLSIIFLKLKLCHCDTNIPSSDNTNLSPKTYGTTLTRVTQSQVSFQVLLLFNSCRSAPHPEGTSTHYSTPTIYSTSTALLSLFESNPSL